MKRLTARAISLLLALILVLGMVPVLEKEAQAWSINQQNIADRADFFFNTTWVCQKTVNGWRDQYTFYEGETYRLPYGQPVNSGEFIGYGVELEEFLSSAADGDSVFYSVQSEYRGWTSVYYATDCAAFVAMCWGTVRQDCSTLPYFSTYKGAPTESNIHNILQLGDALDSTSVGHVVLVSDMIYDDSGELIQIEITEQTPPMLKRTYFTPTELADKYAAEFGIYRYEGSVPAVPEWGYTTECTNYAAYCNIEITNDTPIMSLPCTASVEAESAPLGTAAAGSRYVATRMYNNTARELWYRIALEGEEEGFIYAGDTKYLNALTDDIQLTDAAYPNAHVRGNTFSLAGNLYSKYNQLVTASTYIYKGFGTGTEIITGDSDHVTSNAYTLKNSNIDYNTSFGSLTTGNHTIAIGTTYKNYYATSGTTYEMNSGSVALAEEYFMVVSQSTNQNSCSHNYATTVLTEGTCTNPGITVYSCNSCGKVYKQGNSALGHEFGEWTESDATCTEAGTQSRTCSVCDYVETMTTPATGHTYIQEDFEGNCQDPARSVITCEICGHSYTVYPDEIMSPWQDTLPDGIDEALIESKTQYRTSDLEEITSESDALDGYFLIGESWEEADSTTLDYVSSWPEGFDTKHELYSLYNVEPLTGSENDAQKLEIKSDTVTGYLYYHWCYSNSYYSQAVSSSRYNIFHAYYSTTKPDTYRVDTSDWSYCTSHETCSNTEWFFVAEVKTQTAVTSNKLYQLGRWQEFSEWSDTAAEATDTCKVETRTVYRYPDFTAAGHDYEITETAATCTESGSKVSVCRVCGFTDSQTLEPLGHSYEAEVTEATCTTEGFTTYTCSVCADSYVGDETQLKAHEYREEVTPATCTAGGYTTFICSSCSDSYIGDETQPVPHDYREEVTPATCTAAGYSTFTCSSCSDSYTGNETDPLWHDYVDGLCSLCGAKEVTQLPVLKPKYPTLSFEDEILINVYFDVENLGDITMEDMGLITWAAPKTNADMDNAEHIIPGATMGKNGLYCVCSQGIAAKFLSDTVYFKVYIRLADGSYLYSDLLNYSPLTYAKGVLNGAYSEDMKALVVSLLNYGAAAQTFFSYKPYFLMNSDLTAEQLALVEAYDPEMVSEIIAVDANKLGSFAPTEGSFTRKYPSITFESAFCINYYFLPAAQPVDNVTLYVWKQSDYENAVELSEDNATEVLTMTGNGTYNATVAGIAAKEIDNTVFVAAVYTDAEGNTHCSGVLNYSLGAYCEAQAAGTADVSAFAAATAVYGSYAKAYFNK